MFELVFQKQKLETIWQICSSQWSDVKIGACSAGVCSEEGTKNVLRSTMFFVCRVRCNYIEANKEVQVVQVTAFYVSLLFFAAAWTW